MDKQNSNMIHQMLDAGNRMLKKLEENPFSPSDTFEGLGLPWIKSKEELDFYLWCRLARLRLKVIKGKLTEEEAQVEAERIADKELTRRRRNLKKILNSIKV